MSIELTIFAMCMSGIFITMIFYVLFGQLTVRKLRKNPETKQELGMEFASGWDIFNVAGALAMPRWLNRKLRSTQLSFMYADADLLEKHTTIFDKILAVIFYWLFTVSTLSLFSLMLLDLMGVFD